MLRLWPPPGTLILLLVLPLAGALVIGGCRDVPVDPFAHIASDAGNGGNGGGGAGGTPSDGGAGAGGGGAGGNIPCPNTLIGFATLAGSTTGGGTAAAVRVSTLSDLVAAAAPTTSPSQAAVIIVDGMITVPSDMVTSTGYQVKVESNKTIIGATQRSGLSGGGFLVLNKSNVILKNLTVELAAHTDAITIQASRNVWVDHCALSSDRDHSSGYYDGLVDITHAADYVTVSWTHFFNHYNTSLVGHSDDNGAEDSGHLMVTYHHNLFENTNAGTPRVRFGRVHVFNNHFSGVQDYAIASQMNAEVLVERNQFDNVSVPITNQHEVSATSVPGLVLETGNLYDANSKDSNLITAVDGGTFDFSPPYSYDNTETADFATFVLGSCVGPR